MKIDTLAPNLMVEDVNRTVDFYRNTLGFALELSVPAEGAFDWALMKCGGVELMFQSRKSFCKEFPEFEGKPVGGALSFYVRGANMKPMLEKARGAGVLARDLHETFYEMQEFTVRDCNGYFITFAEQAELICRF